MPINHCRLQWLHANHFYILVVFLQSFGNPGNRAASTDGSNYDIHFTFCICINLLRCRYIMRHRIGQIIKLTAHIAARNFLEQGFRFGDSACHPIGRRRQHNLCSVSPQQALPLLTHILWHGQNHFISFYCSHQRQSYTSIAASRLYNRSARLYLSLFFCILQHIRTHSIFDAATRIKKLHLCQNIRLYLWIFQMHPHQRRAPN